MFEHNIYSSARVQSLQHAAGFRFELCATCAQASRVACLTELVLYFNRSFRCSASPSFSPILAAAAVGPPLLSCTLDVYDVLYGQFTEWVLCF